MLSSFKLPVLNSLNEASPFYLSMQPTGINQTGSIYSNQNILYSVSAGVGTLTITGVVQSTSLSTGVVQANSLIVGTSIISSPTSTSIISNTISIPIAAGYVNNNIANNNYINFNTNHSQLFDDGNLHIHSNTGSIWINPLDSSGVRIGNQYNSGSGAGLIVTGTSSFGNVAISGTLTTNTTSLICIAGLPSNNTAQASVNMVVPLVAQFDPNSWWTPSSNTIIPKIAGWYHFSGQIWWGSGSGTQQLNSQVQKNGSTVSINQANTLSSVGGLVTTNDGLVYCNGTTDAISLTSYSTSTGGQTLQAGTITSGLSSGTFLHVYFVR